VANCVRTFRPVERARCSVASAPVSSRGGRSARRRSVAAAPSPSSAVIQTPRSSTSNRWRSPLHAAVRAARITGVPYKEALFVVPRSDHILNDLPLPRLPD